MAPTDGLRGLNAPDACWTPRRPVTGPTRPTHWPCCRTRPSSNCCQLLSPDTARLRRDGHVLTQGIHPAHASVPGRLPLLHLRQGAAQFEEVLISPPRRCSRSLAQARKRIARKRFSRSAINLRRDIQRPAQRSTPAGAATTLEYLERMARLVLQRDGTVASSQPRRHEP